MPAPYTVTIDEPVAARLAIRPRLSCTWSIVCADVKLPTPAFQLVSITATLRCGEAHPTSDPDGYYQHNLRFHECVAIASGNGVLLESLKTNARKLLAYYRARYRFAGSITQSATEHRTIAQLITDRDSAGAESAMQAHVQFDQVTAMDLIAALS